MSTLEGIQADGFYTVRQNEPVFGINIRVKYNISIAIHSIFKPKQELVQRLFRVNLARGRKGNA